MNTLYNNKYSIIASTIAPNPKEVKYWADLVTDPNGGCVKCFNGTTWESINKGEEVDEDNETNQAIADAVDKALNIMPVTKVTYDTLISSKEGYYQIPKELTTSDNATALSLPVSLVKADDSVYLYCSAMQSGSLLYYIIIINSDLSVGYAATYNTQVIDSTDGISIICSTTSNIDGATTGEQNITLRTKGNGTKVLADNGSYITPPSYDDTEVKGLITALTARVAALENATA